MLLYKPIIQSANIKIPCISTGRTIQRPICAKGKRRSTYSYGKSRDQEIPECICVTTLVRCVCVGFFPMTQVPWVFETRVAISAGGTISHLFTGDSPPLFSFSHNLQLSSPFGKSCWFNFWNICWFSPVSTPPFPQPYFSYLHLSPGLIDKLLTHLWCHS